MSKVDQPYHDLIESIADRDHPRHTFRYNREDSRVMQQVLALDRDQQRAFVLAVIAWLQSHDEPEQHPPKWRVRFAMLTIMQRKLSFRHEDVLYLLDWSISQRDNWSRGIPQVLKAIEEYLDQNTMTDELCERLQKLVDGIQSGHLSADIRKWLARLKQLTGTDTTLPLVAGEAWTDAAIADIRELDATQQAAWLALLSVCQRATGSAPTAKWLKTTKPLLEAVDHAAYKKSVLKWFALVDKPRTEPIAQWPDYQPEPNYLILEINADLLKALAWLCADREDGDLARALGALAQSTYRKLPRIGPRCVRVGNACVWALGNMPGRDGIVQLALLKIKVKLGTAQRRIEKVLGDAAARLGLPPDDIEEMSVPDYGLQAPGIRREQFGDFSAELIVSGTHRVDVQWLRRDGKRQKSVPQTVKTEFKDRLKDFTQTVKDIQKMLPAQRDRIDGLYLQQKQWTLPVWRERYLDHPLIGTLARRLIWKFSKGDRAASGIWYAGRIVDRDGIALDWLDDTTRVELWHPIEASTETVLAWREWLNAHEIQQPFKQAHREIYVFTDAERNTRVYSNRFAAHILRQHQFNALCAARGWKNKLRLMVDDSYPPALRMLPAWGLRAEFWVEGIGDEYRVATNDSGTYLYLSTDQVRFYPITAQQHQAHAGDGGYYGIRRHTVPLEPVPIEDIPPLVLSEIMRDVDLFVGVASVGNDPNWMDGGPEVRYREYWTHYAFGDLTASAKVRKEVLERIVPRLKIADRCTLNDRFLVVRGDLRTYKIHLGSGNILMEPNDQYLCIVPARGTSGKVGDGVFLPFEGDQTLAIILSKALLLADDKKIKDGTITRQIKR